MSLDRLAQIILVALHTESLSGSLSTDLMEFRMKSKCNRCEPINFGRTMSAIGCGVYKGLMCSEALLNLTSVPVAFNNHSKPHRSAPVALGPGSEVDRSTPVVQRGPLKVDRIVPAALRKSSVPLGSLSSLLENQTSQVHSSGAQSACDTGDMWDSLHRLPRQNRLISTLLATRETR
ncbi:hypothetical protein Hamer_G003817 [Homarus americanus]|uniref:Uncharacterized protein n=1 Tax=Homarus americanus TaxID=6706 RepID=A0A8J5NDT3_HOMAM|nr:hypothetical protein Hamer_G003817 [Homarus americanus]